MKLIIHITHLYLLFIYVKSCSSPFKCVCVCVFFSVHNCLCILPCEINATRTFHVFVSVALSFMSLNACLGKGFWVRKED